MPRKTPVFIDHQKQTHYEDRLASQFPELNKDPQLKRKFHDWLHDGYAGDLPIPSYEEYRAAYLEFKKR